MNNFKVGDLVVLNDNTLQAKILELRGDKLFVHWINDGDDDVCDTSPMGEISRDQVKLVE